MTKLENIWLFTEIISERLSSIFLRPLSVTVAKKKTVQILEVAKTYEDII